MSTTKNIMQKVFSALGLLAIFVASPSYATGAGTVLYEENFESGTLSSLRIVGNQTATVVRLSDCNRVGFFRLNKHTDAQFFSAGIPRLFLKPNDRPYRVQFRVYFPDMKRDHAEETIFTIAQKKDGIKGPVSLSINNGQFIFQVNGKTVWCAPYCERRWYDFAIDCLLETPKKGVVPNGYVNLTLDGCTVSRTEGVNVQYVGPNNSVFGISRPSWAGPIAQRTGLPNRQVYFDDLKIIEK